jgi:hypothetical protein
VSKSLRNSSQVVHVSGIILYRTIFTIVNRFLILKYRIRSVIVLPGPPARVKNILASTDHATSAVSVTSWRQPVGFLTLLNLGSMY